MFLTLPLPIFGLPTGSEWRPTNGWVATETLHGDGRGELGGGDRPRIRTDREIWAAAACGRSFRVRHSPGGRTGRRAVAGPECFRVRRPQTRVLRSDRPLLMARVFPDVARPRISKGAGECCPKYSFRQTNIQMSVAGTDQFCTIIRF